MKAHAYISIKRFPWRICGSCGLICLKNAESQRAMRQECRGYFREEIKVTPC